MSSADAAFVTGGTGALGRSVVARFLADGLSVAVTYMFENEWTDLMAAESAASGSGRLFGIRADVTDEDSVRGAVEVVAKNFGGIRVLAHLAGGYAGGVDLERTEASTVRQMIDLNLISAFWVAKHAIPHAKRSGSGRLFFVSSRGAVETYPGAAAYAAAKQLKESGATVNGILPSLIDTPANRASMPKADHSTWVAPAQIAALLSYLASAGAQAVTGAMIPIYGRA
jgi:NAD(P)-dependent dehydrogenase (short-subunit alcohol dehydrogenase family)